MENENLPYVRTSTIEDSGLGESSQNESKNPSNLYTPTSGMSSRKRKILDFVQTSKHSEPQQISSFESEDISGWAVGGGILSSTLNESITTAVEHCKIDSFAVNYYIERSEVDSTSDTSSLIKRIKEPSTPAKYSTKKFCNSNASPRVSPMLKLGSPERNGILYPNLQPNSSRFSDNKRYTPAKKCLFSCSFKKDPVVFFCKDRNLFDIMFKIYSMLADEELYVCSKVSRNWKRSIMTNENLKRRLELFTKNKIMNKENICESPLYNFHFNSRFNQIKQSTPIDLPSTMYELTNSLTEGQHLEKCISCNKPVAIVEKNISQCTNIKCGTVRCTKCNSISKTGPENFIDSCQQATLLIEKRPSRYSLLDSPQHYQNENGIPSFLLGDSTNTSHSANSSGYLTDNEASQSSFFNKRKADISQVLKTCNIKRTSLPEKHVERRNSVLPVITSTRKIIEIEEPSSPPKVKHLACTKKSKKLLKRLNL